MNDHLTLRKTQLPIVFISAGPLRSNCIGVTFEGNHIGSFEGCAPLKMHCRDCALVTSSGHLLRSGQGPQIDQTECVIRMNDAPTRGYGRDLADLIVVPSRKISNTWLSTGWFTMTIALELCDRINVYGMVPPDFCRDRNHPSVPYHYYEPFGPDECTMYLSHERGRKGSHHRFITEKRVFKNWARTFNIHFFQPDWKPESLPINHPENKPVF
nr:PREDICTED: alpha-N-acetylgalactosaminide alpha-2,6-sialyltransferase 5-like [Equus przewalskii]